MTSAFGDDERDFREAVERRTTSLSTIEMTTVHLVSHTHWDREWYRSAVRFRQRLVTLVDELLDAPPPRGASFLLDGQTVVLEDYLAVRPERAAELSTLLTSGALEAGPWFVLADGLIPGAEALIRNLLAGRRTLRALRASAPPVLYCPDSFGHPAGFPALACGFGCDLAIVWRGLGGARRPPGDTFWWTAPSGERVLLYHLSRSGYELGANLPPDADDARRRWASIHDELVARSGLGVVLLLNGADHHARQAALATAVEVIARVAPPDEVRASSLAAFASDLLRRANARPEASVAIAGELRDSYGYTWTLGGTLASRAAQKRRNARLERLLVRDVEPWVALASRGASGRPSRRALVHTAWRSLLLCHPHDTLCGCSTDEVARAMDARLDETEAQGTGLRADALLAFVGHDAAKARERRADWRSLALVRNPAARPRGGVALLRLTTFLAVVPVGPESAAGQPRGVTVPKKVPWLADGGAVQLLSREVAHERTESPRHYPDDDLVEVTEVAAWVPEVPGYGVRALAQTARTVKKGTVPNPVHVSKNAMSNGRISVRVDDAGGVEFTDLERGRTIDDLLAWEDLADLGDLYTSSPRGTKLTPKFNGVRLVHRGPLRVAIDLRWTLQARRDRVDVRVRLIVDANAPWLRVEVDGENRARDHRLRLRVATDVADASVVADAAFGPVERHAVEVSAEEARMELPPRTAPLHRYVSLFRNDRGATLYSDGLAEYEADAGSGALLVTLVRSVGELSRADLPERPGHAGWPTPTPAAQCIGPFDAVFALMLHDARSHRTTDEIERAADDILLPLCGATLRSALAQPEPMSGIELQGPGLAFSCAKESEDGEWTVLRCVNLLDQSCAGRWRLGFPVGEAATVAAG